MSTPLTSRVQANFYGFYLGNAGASIALAEVPVKVQKHFTITPSYLWITVPPSGLELLTGAPATTSYQENQFRIAGTVSFTLHRFTIADRNMYVDRFTPEGQVNRYRNRLYVSHPVPLGSYEVNAFVFDEVYHDFLPQRWLRRNWVAAGLDIPLGPYVTVQPSYIRHDDLFLRSVNFLGLGVIVKTGSLFGREH